MRRVCLALLLAGCFFKPDRPHERSDASTTSDGTMTPDDATLSFDALLHHNIVFVSAKVHGFPWDQGETSQWCSDAAHNAGLLGSYISWMSYATVNAKDRLLQLPMIGDWYLPNGKLFAHTVLDIDTGMIVNPPSIDENGQDEFAAQPSIQVATGTMADGTIQSGYSGECPQGIEVGSPGQRDGTWTASGHRECAATDLHLYCFSFGAH